jgi:hypothetical protein
MADLPVIIPKLIGIIGFAGVGLYHVICAKQISRIYQANTRNLKGALRILYSPRVYGSRWFVWVIRAEGAFLLAVGLAILLLTLQRR